MTPDPNRVLSFPAQRASTPAQANDEALIGPSAAMARVWSQIRRVAPHFRAALVTGEPGSGAEAAARCLHALSPVSQLPFVVVEASQAEPLFTTPLTAIHTVFEGLIFLPDADRLSPVAQRGLVRKLRIRGRDPLRVVAFAATELRAAVSAGRFSSELAEMLGTVRIAMPPLRERTEDIPLLATHFVKRIAERNDLPTPTLEPDFLSAALTFGWPGNLAQLEQMLEHLISTSDAESFTAADFVSACGAVVQPPSLVPPATRMVRLEDVVQEHIRAVLIACHGNKLRAAEVLGISRSTLYRMLDGAPSSRPFSMAG